MLLGVLAGAAAPASASEGLERPAAHYPVAIDVRLREAARDQTAWLEANTAYAAPPLPTISLESQPRLKARCFPGFPAHLVPRVMGVYDPDEAAIHVHEGFDPDDLIDMSYLLHELVHHFQVHSLEVAQQVCRGTLEGEAIRLQLAWLEEQGCEDPMALLGIDEKTLAIIERCR